MCIWFPSIPVLLLTVSNRMFIELITAVLIFVYPLFTGSLTDCLLTQISTSFVIKFELHLMIDFLLRKKLYYISVFFSQSSTAVNYRKLFIVYF
jgi:hypothetical protein